MPILTKWNTLETSSLDVYADEITTSEISPIKGLTVKTKRLHIINVLLYSVLNIDLTYLAGSVNLWYGDYFLYLDIDEELGITNVVPLPLRECERVEGTTRPTLITFSTLSGGTKLTSGVTSRTADCTL